MSSYLEQLTLALATGAAGLPEPFRRQTADYFRSRQQPDGGFAGRAGQSDLYYTGFAVRGLALLGELQDDVAERVAQYLRGRLAGQTPIVDFLSLVYAAQLVELSAGHDVFSAAPAHWRTDVVRTLEAFRRDDGGYAKTEAGASSSTYHTFLVVLCYELLQQPLVAPGRLKEFVLTRQREDGGFVEIGPMKTSGANPTAAAVGLLQILDAVSEDVAQGAVDFLAGLAAETGGLCANTRIPWADVLSTFTGLWTLRSLRAAAEIDSRAAARFVRGALRPDGGFSGGDWDEGTDVEYSFYGLGALAILAEIGEDKPTSKSGAQA